MHSAGDYVNCCEFVSMWNIRSIDSNSATSEPNNDLNEIFVTVIAPFPVE